ncbi:hypothetical protein [Nitrosopumilus sp.]|uniref:hypothetical protein n=1 Tax=Nitrosopumilus sp. TaxID=2024843 RepID=UPI00292F450A|nr:hypothetical protein [Nitrosopumilus sp.]
MTNTLLRQVMCLHRQYWKDRDEDNISDREIFVVNLCPSVKHGVPTSPDAIQNRQLILLFMTV